ncbi:hypothetical protein ACFX1Q_020501 [Malus domestica]
MKAEALTLVQSACYPIAEYLAVRHNRAHGIALGTFLWATATFLVAFSSTFTEVAMSRALNGIGLALLTPAIQSLVADSTDDNNRDGETKDSSQNSSSSLWSHVKELALEAKSVIKIPSFQIVVAQGVTGSFP